MALRRRISGARSGGIVSMIAQTTEKDYCMSIPVDDASESTHFDCPKGETSRGRLTREKIEALLRTSGIPGDFSLQPVQGGGNNRLYKITAGGHAYLLKQYFVGADDPRDRCATEFGFASFLWDHGIRCIARPVGRSGPEGLALYDYIEGRRPDRVTGAAVDRALDFLTAINEFRSAPDAAHLPEGSEACFSIREHIATVEKRIDSLKAMEVSDDGDKRALGFVTGELAEAWQRWMDRAQLRDASESTPSGACRGRIARGDGSARKGTERLAGGERILSPSDFGFHNALVTDAGALRFVDFEYAGWDDPAKTVGDFFSQVSVPAPLKHYYPFVERLSAMAGDRAAFIERSRLLLPLYRIKWCCIILNHFLPAGCARRQFAGDDAERAKRSQLKKAQELLASIETMEKELTDGLH
jgi:hypothetical protein